MARQGKEKSCVNATRSIMRNAIRPKIGLHAIAAPGAAGARHDRLAAMINTERVRRINRGG